MYAKETWKREYNEMNYYLEVNSKHIGNVVMGQNYVSKRHMREWHDPSWNHPQESHNGKFLENIDIRESEKLSIKPITTNFIESKHNGFVLCVYFLNMAADTQRMLLTSKFSGAKIVLAGSCSPLLVYLLPLVTMSIVLPLSLSMGSCCEYQWRSSQRNRNHINYFNRENLILGMSCTDARELKTKENSICRKQPPTLELKKQRKEVRIVRS